VRTLTGNERVDALFRGLPKFRPGTSGNYTDAPANLRASRDQESLSAKSFFQPGSQLSARDPCCACESNGLAMTFKERAQARKAQRSAEQGVVTKTRVSIQRQVSAVYGKVMFQQRPQQLVTRTDPRVRRAPEQSVVNDEEIRPGFRRQVYRGQAGVHGRRDAPHAPEVLDLQPIHRPAVVPNFPGAENPVAVTNDS
jgi:hypothetical protein